MLTRRNFLRGLVAAPAVVAACNIMPVRQVIWSPSDNLMISEAGRWVRYAQTTQRIFLARYDLVEGWIMTTKDA